MNDTPPPARGCRVRISADMLGHLLAIPDGVKIHRVRMESGGIFDVIEVIMTGDRLSSDFTVEPDGAVRDAHPTCRHERIEVAPQTFRDIQSIDWTNIVLGPASAKSA